MTPEPSWSFALECAASSRIVLLLGDSDSGKTSLTTWLAAQLARPEHPVAVVDADLGQSRIGPPTTVGLGRVATPIQSLAEAEVLAVHWVGSTSPAPYADRVVEATGCLVEQAVAAGFAHVLVDTCGLVRDARGAALKLAQIRRVAPDLVICFRRADECDLILRELAGAPRPGVLTFPVGPQVRRVSQEERRRRRRAAFEAYFAGAGVSVVPLDAVAGLDASVASRLSGELFDTVVGLLDARGDTLGIGRIDSVDLVRNQLCIETPVPSARITRVELGIETFRSTTTSEVIR
jgi:polynucleotide 5'-hydroxyl-kinase GRC3/NOL9